MSSSSPEAPRLLLEALRFDRSGPCSFSFKHGICAGKMTGQILGGTPPIVNVFCLTNCFRQGEMGRLASAKLCGTD